MAEQYDIDKIIADYLQGRLSEEESEVFEVQLQQDEQLSARVRQESLIQDLVVRQAVQSKMDHLNLNPSGPQWRSRLLWGGLLALITGAVVAVLFFNGSESQTVPDVAHQPKQKNTTKTTTPKEDEQTAPRASSPDTAAEAPATENQKAKKSAATSPKDTTMEILLPDSSMIVTPDTSGKDTSQHIATTTPEPDTLDNEAEDNEADQKEKEPKNCQLTATIDSSPSCIDSPTGVVEVWEVTGGKRPYIVTIDKQQTSGLSDIPAGKYSVLIEDDQNCTYTETITVKEELCVDEKTHVYNLRLQNNWEYPVSNKFSGTLQITDRNGRVIWRETIQEGYPEGWNGNTLHGNAVTTGAYAVIIKHTNGKTARLTLNVVNR